jgi:hypothetical protein
MRLTALATIVTSFVIATSTPGAALLQQAPAPTPVTIPFELAVRHIILKAAINKSRPVSFILDTGANRAIVRLDVARELGLSLYGNVRTGGAGAGSQQGFLVRDAMWSLAGLDGFEQPVTLALPFTDLPSGMGRDIDGIVGGEFIREFVVELDYQTRTISLHNPKTFVYTGRGEAQPIELNSNGHPIVTATVTLPGGRTVEAPFVLDIGSGMALALHSPFVAEHKLPPPDSKTIRAIGVAGAGGKSHGRIGRVDSLKVGSFTIKSPLTVFSEDKAGALANAQLAGNIGAQIANRFRMFIDYGRKRIILEPSPTFADPFDRAHSGIALRAGGADFRTFRVHEVLEDSPATEAGIQEGDIITAIDDRPGAGFTLSEIAEMFEKPGAYALTIRRGEQAVKVSLKPRRLI